MKIVIIGEVDRVRLEGICYAVFICYFYRIEVVVGYGGDFFCISRVVVVVIFYIRVGYGVRVIRVEVIVVFRVLKY